MVPSPAAILGPAGQEATTGVVLLKSKLLGGAATVKFALEISKKILPIASTLILAEAVTGPGIVTTSEPSFGVLAKISTG